ncbi:NUDIX hydrolase [Myceligenerans crystallogenes]|uniref:Nudix hydrolase domain-containing protein n=1 Tax=Myceligenerans crystallogenes TaxID=316335 RepID=A0ABN2NKM0_9MICO
MSGTTTPGGGTSAAGATAGPAGPSDGDRLAGPDANGRYDDRDHERFALVPAAYVMLRRSGADGSPEVLLQLRQNTGYRDGHWACAAAGHVEAGESVLTAAVREAREELGVTVDPADLRPLTVLHRGEPGGPAIEQRVDFFFETTTWQGTPAIQEPGKAAGLAWFRPDALPDPVVPHEATVLAALSARESGGPEVPRVLALGF